MILPSASEDTTEAEGALGDGWDASALEAATAGEYDEMAAEEEAAAAAAGLLAGGGSQIKGLDRAITAKMQEMLGGGNVIRIEEPIYGGANGALKIAHDMPEEYWEQLK